MSFVCGAVRPSDVFLQIEDAVYLSLLCYQYHDDDDNDDDWTFFPNIMVTARHFKQY